MAMQKTSVIIFGLALIACALTRLPDKYKPAWSHRLKSSQTLIGLVAVIMAILIVMSPEFFALGILGDSAFFDLLVLAIGLQLQTVLSRSLARCRRVVCQGLAEDVHSVLF